MNAHLSRWNKNENAGVDAHYEFVDASLILKLIFIAIAIALHVLLFYAAMYSPSQRTVAKPAMPANQFVSAILLSDSLEKSSVPEVIPEIPQQSKPSQSTPILTKPVAPQEKMKQKKIHQTDQVQRPSSANKSTELESAQPVASSPPSQAGNPVIGTQAVLEPGMHCPKPDYPKASRRLLEEGIVTLNFLVDTDGHVLKAEIAKSSGFERLDDAARTALSKCQFRPGSSNGHPVQSWSSIRYAWRLK
ncbi:MAG: energy transducer TonB [Sheuella sp.]|nr:energy transducer TonB [Sheuella sp.]